MVGATYQLYQAVKGPPGFTATAGFTARWDRERGRYMVVEAAPILRRVVLTYSLPEAVARLQAQGWRIERV